LNKVYFATKFNSFCRLCEREMILGNVAWERLNHIRGHCFQFRVVFTCWEFWCLNCFMFSSLILCLLFWFTIVCQNDFEKALLLLNVGDALTSKD